MLRMYRPVLKQLNFNTARIPSLSASTRNQSINNINCIYKSHIQTPLAHHTLHTSNVKHIAASTLTESIDSTTDQLHNQQSHSNQYNVKLQRIVMLGAAGAILYLLVDLVPVPVYADSPAMKSIDTDQLNGSSIDSEIQQLANKQMAAKFSLFTRVKLIIKLLFRLPMLGIMWLPIFGGVWFLGSNKLFLKYIVWVLENSGPGFVKLGQWAATRPDLFYETACSVLSELQTGAKAHKLKYSLKSISEMFPFVQIDVRRENNVVYNYCVPHTAREKQLYEEFGRIRIVVDGSNNLGSGSMAQTHRGTVYCERDNTQADVAIKILHPDIRNRVESDLMLMQSVTYIVDRLPGGFKWLGAGDAIQQFSQFLHSHLDLKREGDNLTRFQKNFAAWNTVTFPTTVYNLASPNVLVETLQHGIGLDELMSRSSPALRAHSRPIAKIGLKMFLTMMIDHNFIHSDLHPGNILVDIDCEACHAELAQKKQEKKSHKRITRTADAVQVQNNSDYNETNLQSNSVQKLQHNINAPITLQVIDPGLVTELDPRNRANFLSLFGALVQGDGRLAAELILKYARKQSCTDPDGFMNEMDEIVSGIPVLDIGAADIGVLLQKVLTIVRNYKVGLETDFASLVVGLVVVEGVGRRLDPKLSLVKEAAPVLIANSEARNIILQRGGARLLESLVVTAAEYLFSVKQDDEKHHTYYQAQRELIESDWDAS